MLYLQFLVPAEQKKGDWEPKDSLRKIEKNIKEQISTAYHKFPYRTGRLITMLNIINLMNFARNNEPSRETLDIVVKGAAKFSADKLPPSLSVLGPVFLQMYARYHLLSESHKCYRMFFAATFRASVFFLKKSGLHDFAKAGCIITSKYYQVASLEGFNQILQTVYENLGRLREDNTAELLEAVDCYIRALNNHQLPSAIPAESEKNLKKSTLMKATLLPKVEEQPDSLTESMILVKKTSQPPVVDLLDLPLSTGNESTMLTSSVASPTRHKFASDDFINKMKSLKTLSFGPQSIHTQHEQAFELETGQAADPKVHRAQLEKITEVLEYKLEKKDFEALNNKLKFGMVAGVQQQASACMRPREISVGEPVFYRMSLTNHYFRKVAAELQTLQLEVQYLATWERTMGKVGIQASHRIPEELANEHFSFSINYPEVGPSETVELEIAVRFKKQGFFKLAAISWTWFDCVTFRHQFEEYQMGFPHNYTVLKVSNEAPHIECAAFGLKPKLQLGEVHKSVLTARVIGDKPVEECYMISSEPLYTGFGFKPVGPIPSAQSIDLEFYLRGTQAGKQVIPVMFLYKTCGQYKYLITYFRVAVETTFTSHFTIDDLQDGTRIVSLDILANPKEGAPKPDQLEICSVGLNSNHWEIVEGSHQLRKLGTPPALLLLFQIKPTLKENEDSSLLKRKHREIFDNQANWLQLSEDKLECTHNFLVHENIAITRSPIQEELCRDYIDVTMIIKAQNAGETIYYMRSLTQMKTYSVSWALKDKSNQQVRTVKTKFLVPNVVEHNFEESPLLSLPVEVRVDCSMLADKEHPHIYVRAINPSEKKPEHRQSGVEKPMKENLFNWVGRTKLMIEKSPNKEPPIIRSDRDWSSIRRMFEEVSSIQHFAVFDAKTGEIWMSSADFKFETYEEGPENSKKLNIDEKTLAIKFFQMQGNVKTNIGVRYMRQKFIPRPKGGYDTNKHMSVFLNEQRTMGGVAGRTGACIMVGLYSKNLEESLGRVDPEMQLKKIYQRLLDADRGYLESEFTEDHRVKFTALIPGPGVYELNSLEFTDSKGNLLHNPCASSEVKVVVRHDQSLASLL